MSRFHRQSFPLSEFGAKIMLKKKEKKGLSTFLQNKSGSILKTKAPDKCSGDERPCARRLPVCSVPKPNLRLEFPPKPCQWAQLELFISWWMGPNNPERRACVCVCVC